MITVYYSAPELPGLGNSFKGVMTEPVIVCSKATGHGSGWVQPEDRGCGEAE